MKSAPFSASAGTPLGVDIDDVVHVLQEHANRHGELIDALLIAPDDLRQCWQQHQQSQLEENERARFRLNLFNESPQPSAEENEVHFALKAYQCWIDHLERCALITVNHEPERSCRQKICQWLIEFANQLDLQERLKAALAPYQHNAEASISCVCSELNEFVSWLGYKDEPQELRPNSRVQQGLVIFSRDPEKDQLTSLSRLADEPTYSNFPYIGDWIVALYTRVQALSMPDEELLTGIDHQ